MPEGAAGTTADAVLPPLRRLDAMLEAAMARAEALYGPGAAADPHRGLYVTREEAETLLDRAPGEPALAVERADGDAAVDASPLGVLQRTFGLSAFDADVVALALAPELDLRYERVYSYLQDDVTRRRPSVALALDLLCEDAADRLAKRSRFGPDGPLLRQRLLHLREDPSRPHAPLPAQALELDAQVVRFLLGDDVLDARLVRFCRLADAAPREGHGVVALSRQARAEGRPLRLAFEGPDDEGKRDAAAALAAEAGAGLLLVDVAAALEEGELDQTLLLALRHALLHRAIPYLERIDELTEAARRRLLDALAAHPGIVVVSSSETWAPEGVPDIVVVPFPIPDFAARRAVWERLLAEARIDATDADVDALAGRFRLVPARIADAIATASSRALWRAAADPAAAPQVTPADLFAAARTHSGKRLSALAVKIEPKQRWENLILPPDQVGQLRDICDRAAYRHVVYGDWGFERRLSLGKGLNVLFSGGPGTGKTMAAEVIAGELELDLYKIDLSQIVSKYIGETEKNLHQVFREAQASSAILFFDEADALFGKRSEVKDAHDRYANIEVGYLLQKMDEHDGIVVLATNLRQNMDEAFSRRLHALVDFPFPDEEHRLRIWQVVFPPEAPLAPDVDLAALASAFALAGGNIRNIALAAAFYAAPEGRAIKMADLARAARREFQKLGRTWTEPDWSPA